MQKQDATISNVRFLNNYLLLEDDIYLSIDKLQALCAAQTLLDADDTILAPTVRFHYSMIIEEHVVELRSLLDKVFTG